MQPTRQRLARVHSRRFTGEDEEHCLECILGVMQIARYSPADVKHHRSMPVDQCCESGLISAGNEAIQECRVSGFLQLCRIRQPAKIPH
jgi:hypothetical protein